VPRVCDRWALCSFPHSRRGLRAILAGIFAVSFSSTLILLAGCAAQLSGVLPGAIMGRIGVYDYSPSVIQTGPTEQFWWCGYAKNPNRPSQSSDTILYATYDTTTDSRSAPQTVLGETPNSWDSAYTCNAQVVQGSFVNPLGDGQTYSYAMYYVGTNQEPGAANSIGVAFSSDGIHWRKYPEPVIRTTTQINYGVGQPVPYNSDHKSAITLFYENANGPIRIQHYEATSTDGVHFTTVGKLTTRGLRIPHASWGDMAYDPASGYWYAAFNEPLRYLQTTGNHQERGQRGVALYRIPDSSLLTGDTPWRFLHSFDTNSTGNEANFIAGFRRDTWGNLALGPNGTVELYPSISNPATAWDASPRKAYDSSVPDTWDIGRADWTPGHTLVSLGLYASKATQVATTGWVDPDGSFTLQSTLGQLYEIPQHGATTAFYACKAGTRDYFISTDPFCNGQRIIGLEGYGYAQPQAKLKLSPLYSCSTGAVHFASTSATCNNAPDPALIGYILSQ
jgi:hypothetical protein